MTPTMVRTAQLAWRALTPTSRRALLQPQQRMHPATRAALVRRGLLDADGTLTAAGRAAVQHRPARTGPATWFRTRRGRPIITVHLPEETP